MFAPVLVEALIELGTGESSAMPFAGRFLGVPSLLLAPLIGSDTAKAEFWPFDRELMLDFGRAGGEFC